MNRHWRMPLLRMGALALLCTSACDTPNERSQVNSALAQCAHPAITFDRVKRRAALPAPMVLPVPAIIPVSGGKAETATLNYSLSADGNRALLCRYQRTSTAEMRLVSCDREVDATSWLEASAIELSFSEAATTSSLTVCPVGPVVDVAKLRPAPEEQFPRGDQLRGQEVPFEPIPGARTVQDVEAYVQTARSDARVQRLLGERSAYIQEIAVGDPKSQDFDPHYLRLIFFNHAQSRTVEVLSRRGQVESTQYIPYWPPEGKEEIAQAISLAKQDLRLVGKVNDLREGGMVWQPTANVEYLNHRVMDIRFYDDNLISRFYATVDLTDLKVQAAGPIGGT
jgi:hypothetical protein